VSEPAGPAGRRRGDDAVEAGGEARPCDERDLRDVFRRSIHLVRAHEDVVVGALEDTAHHVRVTLTTGEGRVVRVEGEGVRLPWTTCPGAVPGLASLVGSEVTTAIRPLRDRYDPAAHCTHLFDLAHLAIAHAARRADERLYEIVIEDRLDPAPAYLFRDGCKVLEWKVSDGEVVAPAPFAGLGLAGGFLSWCAQLDEEAAEAAFVLRRAAVMARVAHIDFDGWATAADTGLRAGVCFTAQPGRLAVATRNVGSQRDYTGGSERMLAGFDEAVRRARPLPPA
jgi:DUF2889 family protein